MWGKATGESKKSCIFALVNLLNSIIMSTEERRARMAANRAVNSKKPARSAFMRWARAHRGAFIINDPELKTKLVTYID